MRTNLGLVMLFLILALLGYRRYEIERTKEAIREASESVRSFTAPKMPTLADLVRENFPPAVPDDDKKWEIVSLNTRRVEVNQMWGRHSWILKIKNDSDSTLAFDATVEWLDSGGFVLDDDTEYGLVVGPKTTETFTGHGLVTQPVTEKVVNAQVKVIRRR